MEVGGLSSVAAVSAGDSHTCALTLNGEIYCWGANDRGQLGDGTTVGRPIPTRVLGMPKARRLAAGNRTTCAVSAVGGAWCWGLNLYGQLGNGSRMHSTVPVAVESLAGKAREISTSGYHTCAVATDDSVGCWGANDEGQLGDGGKVEKTRPSLVLGGWAGTQGVANGFGHSCAISTTGVRCWGGNLRGQLGDGTTTSRTTPVAPLGLPPGISIIVAGHEHTCAMTSDQRVLCWGLNADGQLGNGATAGSNTPVPVVGL